MVIQICDYSKNHWIIHFKKVNFMVYKYQNITLKNAHPQWKEMIHRKTGVNYN